MLLYFGFNCSKHELNYHFLSFCEKVNYEFDSYGNAYKLTHSEFLWDVIFEFELRHNTCIEAI